MVIDGKLANQSVGEESAAGLAGARLADIKSDPH
jgi:hypothetical protein